MEVSGKVWRLDGCTKRVRCGGYEPPAARRHILGRKISHVATFAFAGGSGQRAAAWRRRHATIVAAMASGTSCGASRPRDSESSSSVICIERFDLFYLFNLFNLCNHLQQQQRPGRPVPTHQLTATATILHAAAGRCMTGQISHPSLVGELQNDVCERVCNSACSTVRAHRSS